MSTHRHIEKICCVVLAVAVLITVFMFNAEYFGVEKTTLSAEYENTLFDASTVHTIDIVIDDAEEFLANCQSEEYSMCNVVIDGTLFKNVAIRGKGNTSLTQVSSYGNNRYSFKIEFDHYDSTNTYYGLDKLCLNNIIQDNTYMKDYLTYTLMNEFGVSAPLCSYADITINGEAWGLYLAVEGVEEAFLSRNFGTSYGDLYKPDSMDMGGGRGNGNRFDMNEIPNNNSFDNSTDTSNGILPEISKEQNNSGNSGFDMQQGNAPEMPSGGMQEGNVPEMPSSDMQGGMQKGNAPDMPSSDMQGGMQKDDVPDMPSGDMQGGMQQGNAPDMPNDGTQGGMQQGNAPDMPSSDMQGGMQKDDVPDMPNGDTPGGISNSSDVMLNYIDDDPESYPNIFDNAKTDITTSDKTRLIESLKKLNNGEDLNDILDIEKVIKYFVVHNFVLNFDSYTGTMGHNYYLYEEDGTLQMIPWDYNLAFGGFGSGQSADELINYPIDTPVSGDSVDTRPMLSWIFENEEYTEMYHEYFSKFINDFFNSGYFENLIDSTESMISSYVEKDSTKFCTFEEFQKGVSTLKEFCLLRAASVEKQLSGEISTQSSTQDSDTFVKANGIEISDMGSMNMSGGSVKPADIKHTSDAETNGENSSDKAENGISTSESTDEASSDEVNSNKNTEIDDESPNNVFEKDFGKDFFFDDNNAHENKANYSTIITLAVSLAVLIFGISFAILYKRRK